MSRRCCPASARPLIKLAGRQTALCCALLLALIASPAAHSEIAREYRIKAAYLYNLLRFITWPDGAWEAGQPVSICVYGYNPFEQYLEKLESRTVEQHPIEVRYIPERQQLSGCDMVFVSQYNTTEPRLLSANTPGAPILTVGDGDHFLRRGGMVGLVNVGNNIQLDINRTRGREAGFQFSANLLEVARSVQ